MPATETEPVTDKPPVSPPPAGASPVQTAPNEAAAEPVNKQAQKPDSSTPPPAETPAASSTPSSQQPPGGGDKEELSVTPASSIETEVLPAEEKEDSPKKILLLVMRALRGKSAEEPSQALTRRGPTEIAPTVHGGLPPQPPFWRRHAVFLATVVVPTLLSVLYFALYATDIYVSESSYVVRSPNKQSSATSGLGALLQGAGFSGFAKAPDDVYAVSQYIRSRDALTFLDEKLDLHAAWQSNDIDLLHRFDALGWAGTIAARRFTNTTLSASKFWLTARPESPL